MNGNELICAALERLGVSHVFGVAGTQNVGLFEALRRSRLRTVAATSESSAAFMAVGYYRASGRLAALTTIPGPGFAYTLAPLAEALHDSAAFLYITDSSPETGHTFSLQALDQTKMAGPVTKAIFNVDELSRIPEIIAAAWSQALNEEPGPVMVQIRPSARNAHISQKSANDLLARCQPGLVRSKPSPEQISAFMKLLRSSRRPLLYAGQGTLDCAEQLLQLAEALQAPVVMTRSARGVLPMNHPLAFAFDFNADGGDRFNELLDQSDLIVVLGCKLGHNGTAGFTLRLPEEKLVRIDSSDSVLRSNYSARLQMHADVPAVLTELLSRAEEWGSRSRGWELDKLHSLQMDGRSEIGEERAEPQLIGEPASPSAFFHSLQRSLPPDSCLLTDSGQHQVLATRYFSASVPRGLVIPSDFQSMGFGISAAIGAKFACPGRPVVLIIGDGGMAMTATELLTAMREKLDLTVIVFNDEALGQIQQQQRAAYGFAHCTSLQNPDFKLLAESMGIGYERWSARDPKLLKRVIGRKGITLLEVGAKPGAALKMQQLKGVGKSWTHNVFGESAVQWLRRKVSKQPGKVH